MDNKKLIEELTRFNYLSKPLIIEAFEHVDRKNFVSEKNKSEAYVNEPLSIGEGQTISQPLVVAFMLELLNPRPGEKILDVGSGSGWQTALLAYCVSATGADGVVLAVERIPELKKFGENNISKYSFIEKGVVKVIQADASKGVPKKFIPPGGFDKIIAGASASKDIPKVWTKILCVGGKIVAPIGNSIVEIEKGSKNNFERTEHFGFSFVPLVEEKNGT